MCKDKNTNSTDNFKKEYCSLENAAKNGDSTAAEILITLMNLDKEYVLLHEEIHVKFQQPRISASDHEEYYRFMLSGIRRLEEINLEHKILLKDFCMENVRRENRPGSNFQLDKKYKTVKQTAIKNGTDVVLITLEMLRMLTETRNELISEYESYFFKDDPYSHQKRMKYCNLLMEHVDYLVKVRWEIIHDDPDILSKLIELLVSKTK